MHLLREEISTIYHENRGRYGYRRITAELRKRTFSVNHKTVQRLMKGVGACRVRMKKYRFKQELIEYMDYYNNRRIKAKRKGLPPAILNSKPFRLLEQFYCKILSNFWGSLHLRVRLFFCQMVSQSSRLGSRE